MKAAAVAAHDRRRLVDAAMVKLPSTRGRFVSRLARNLAERCGVEPGAGLLAAVSGGADSRAMLAGLGALARRPHLRYRVTVAHVHHHLRPEADAEAAEVEALAARLGLGFVRRDIEPGSAKGNVEATARRLRYAVLAEVAESAGAKFVVTAHHGGDQLETVLAAFAKGAGLMGMAGMAWRRRIAGSDVDVVRPMLDSTHEECVAVLERIGWEWSEDATNRDGKRMRARLRAEVLPGLRVIVPGVQKRVQESVELWREAAGLVEREVEAVFGACDAGAGETGEARFERGALRAAPKIVVGAGLRRCAGAMGASARKMTWRVVRAVVEAIGDDQVQARRFEWPGGVVVRVTRSEVIVARGHG